MAVAAFAAAVVLLVLMVVGGRRTRRIGGGSKTSSKDGRYCYIGVMMPLMVPLMVQGRFSLAVVVQVLVAKFVI